MRITPEQAKKLGIPTDGGKKPRGKSKAKGTETAGGINVTLLDAMFKANGIEHVRYEVPFAEKIGRKWSFDILIAGWLAVEIDGGLYGRGPACPTCGRRAPGAHSSVERMKSDRQKFRDAVRLGYSVVQFLPEEIQDGSAFAEIKELLGGVG